MYSTGYPIWKCRAPIAFAVVEVRFKNGRKDFYRNTDRLILTTGDAVMVEATTGHHLGYVSLQGELVRLQMQKKKIANDDEIKKIYQTCPLKKTWRNLKR